MNVPTQLDLGGLSQQSKAEQITFGSVIYLNLSDNKDYFLYNEGFLNTRLVLKYFSNNGDSKQNFQNCLFKIMPFSSESNFKSQNKVIKQYQDLGSNQFEFTSAKELKDRKTQIQELKQNIEVEINVNMGLYDKLKGQPLLFGISTFQLVHITSMKYLSLNENGSDDNKDNLYFTLVDFPDDKSFYRILPSLRFQKQRNNIVYNQDLVSICCTKAILNRNPFIHSEYQEQEQIKQINSKKIKNIIKVIASIEDSRKFRLNLYQQKIDDDSLFLNIGDIVWLNLSERKYQLVASKINDPFDNLIENKFLKNKFQSNTEQRLGSQELRSSRVLAMEKIKIEQSIHINSNIHSPYTKVNESKFQTVQQSQGQGQEQEQLEDSINRSGEIQVHDQFMYDDDMYENLELEFAELQPPKTQIQQSFAINTKGMWKIESILFYQGGLLKWDTPYILRHVISGKYLCVKKFLENYSLDLSHKKDENSLFYFSPIANFIEDGPNKFLIPKDAFFRLQHAQTKLWIVQRNNGFDLERQIHTSINFEDLNINLGKAPKLNKKVSASDTLKMRRADYEEIWETKFLQSSLPVIAEMERYIKIKNQNNEREINIFERRLEEAYNRMNNCLDFLKQFSNNRLTSNIMIGEDFDHPSIIRQSILREQKILGLICWVLGKLFPSEKDMPHIDYQKILNEGKKNEFDIRAITLSASMFNVASTKKKEKLEKDVKTKCYQICIKLYEVLTVVCLKNEENQEYIFKFIPVFFQHIGYGNFVCDALIKCFTDNEKILYGLHRVSITSSLEELKALSQKDVDVDKTSVINEIILKLQQFPSYQKYDILKFLSTICYMKDKAIYINQEKIYSTLIKNDQIFQKALIHIQSIDNVFNVQFKNEQGEIENSPLESYFSEEVQEPMRKEMVYLLNQLELYASLCMSRNYACVQYFSKYFPLETLRKYFFNQELPATLRAVLLKLMLNLYVDKEPRKFMIKPNLIRVVEDNQTNSQENDQNYSNRSEKERLNIQEKSPSEIPLIKQRSSDVQMFTPTKENLIQYNKLKNQEIKRSPQTYQDLDDEDKLSIIEQNEDEIKSLNALKNDLLDYLRIVSEKIGKSSSSAPSIYNIVTLEVIKTLLMMLKFGLFEICTTQKVEKKQMALSTFADIVLRNDKLKYENLQPQDEIEQLVMYLTPLLEYDESYFRALSHLKIQRKFQQFKSNVSKISTNLKSGVTEIGKSLTTGLNGLTDIFNLSYQTAQKSSKKSNINSELDTEIIKDPIFKKSQALKKILQKFSNKTYTVKDESSEQNPEILIKVQICEALNYILDLREDYLIDNVLEYFQKTFTIKINKMNQEELSQLNASDEFISLLPDNMIEVGNDLSEVERKFQNYTEFKDIRFFDNINNRPFIESLFFAFYFTNDPVLQNTVLDLIHRCATQKEQLLKNIANLEIINSLEHKKLLFSIKQLLESLKNIVFNAQVWLQIYDKKLYTIENEQIVDKTLSKFKKIESIFQRGQTNLEGLKIRQRIFCYLGGHKLILQLLNNALYVLEVIEDICEDNDPNEIQQKYHSGQLDKVMNLFRICYSILTLLCQDNKELKFYIYSKLNFFMLNNKLNVGQIALICAIFQDNFELCKDANESLLQYFINLISIHGKNSQFLEIFDVFISNNREDNIELQKRVLKVLLSEQNMQEINPFTIQKNKENIAGKIIFFEQEDQLLYSSKLIKIISKCIQGDVGVNLISKSFKILNFKTLFQLMTENTQKLLELEKDNHQNVTTLLAGKSAIIEMIQLYLQRVDNAMDQLMERSFQLLDLVELENKLLNKKSKHQFKDNILYILEKFVPLLNGYAQHSFKDLQLFSGFNDTGITKEEIAHDKLYNFGKNLIDEVSRCLEIDIKFQEQSIQPLSKMSKILKIELPAEIQNIINFLEEEEQNQQNFGQISTIKKKQGDMDLINKKMSFSVTFKKTIGFIGKSIRLETKKGSFISENWNLFKEKILQDKQVETEIENELNVLSNSIMNIQDIFLEEESNKEFLLNTEDILIKFINYLEYWVQKKASRESIIFLIKALGRIISSVEEDELQMVNRQEMLDKYNATKDKGDDTEYIQNLLQFAITLLNQGNPIIQKRVIDFLRSNSYFSEKLFQKMNQLISEEINRVEANRVKPDQIQDEKTYSNIKKLLRVMQLFCEGHNLDLQNYLRQQTNSKNNYDMIAQTVKLLSSYKINIKNYDIVLQCFDTLTEFIQGPCKQNQDAIINTKFLEYAVSILQNDERVYEFYSNSFSPNSKSKLYASKQFQSELFQSQLSLKASDDQMKNGSSSRVNQQSDNNNNQMYRSRTKSMINRQDTQKNKQMIIKTWQLSRIKFKCLITIVSLLEGCESNKSRISRIMRALPISVLTKNLVQIYELYKKIYKTEQDYTEQCFKHQDKEIDEMQLPTEQDELIIENGFNIFILINQYMDDSNQRDIADEDEELNEFLQEFKEDNEGGFLKGTIFGEFTKLGVSIFSLSVSTLKDIKKLTIDKMNIGREEELKALKEMQDYKLSTKEALTFFRKNTAHIEIIRDNQLEKVYFPILPFCKTLAKTTKHEFHERVDRTSTQSKITYLTEQASQINKQMKHDEFLRILFNKNRLFGFFASQGNLWEQLAFFTNLFLNFIVICSFSEENSGKSNRLKEPRLFFNKEFTWTNELISTLGAINLGFSSLVVFFFIVKRAPLIIQPIWQLFWKTQLGFFKRIFVFFLNCFKSIFVLLSDFDLLFYTAYIGFVLMGILVHPFFFAFHLTDFLRIELLKNVVKSVWDPKKQLFLTFCVFCLFEYYFTIIGYIYFHDHYGGRCENLWRCFLTTIDYTFKNGGAIGSSLQDPEQLGAGQPGSHVNIPRFFFDNIFNILLVFIVINMVAGIIIDTFGSRKDALQAKEEDMQRVCFICGINREKLERSSDGFFKHIKKDHYMWNYLFYQAYLEFKESTEYNGTESYIKNKMDKFDISWFPIKRALSVEDEKEEENDKLVLLNLVTTNMTTIRGLLEDSIKKVNRIIDNIRPNQR